MRRSWNFHSCYLFQSRHFEISSLVLGYILGNSSNLLSGHINCGMLNVNHFHAEFLKSTHPPQYFDPSVRYLWQRLPSLCTVETLIRLIFGLVWSGFTLFATCINMTRVKSTFSFFLGKINIPLCSAVTDGYIVIIKQFVAT